MDTSAIKAGVLHQPSLCVRPSFLVHRCPEIRAHLVLPPDEGFFGGERKREEVEEQLKELDMRATVMASPAYSAFSSDGVEMSEEEEKVDKKGKIKQNGRKRATIGRKRMKTRSVKLENILEDEEGRSQRDAPAPKQPEVGNDVFVDAGERLVDLQHSEQYQKLLDAWSVEVKAHQNQSFLDAVRMDLESRVQEYFGNGDAAMLEVEDLINRSFGDELYTPRSSEIVDFSVNFTVSDGGLAQFRLTG